MKLKLALSTLCENPRRRTGLSTLFPEFIRQARRQFPAVTWVVFAGPDSGWPSVDPGVEIVTRYPANDRRASRLWADHFRVAAAARRSGAAALLTVGFAPVRAAGLPVIMHVFSVPRQGPGGGWRGVYRRWAVARGMARAALVIVNSQCAAAVLAAPPGRLLVSPEGLQRERFTAEGAAGGPGLADRYLLWVSNFYPYKRVELALAAYARLSPELRKRLPFILVGGDWEGGRRRAEATVAGLGIDGDVRFLGWVADADLPSLYRGARAHLLSTADESFGRSVLEAMACGCPCVVQDLPVLREVTGGAARFVDFSAAAEAGAAIEEVCVDDALAGRLRAAGLARAADFSFERLARERMAAILDRLGVSPDRGPGPGSGSGPAPGPGSGSPASAP